MLMRPRISRLAAVFSLPLALTAAGVAAADPIIGCVESATYPIKVCYEADADIPLADEILVTAEQIWAIVVVQLGFTEPWRLDTSGTPEHGVEVVLTDLGENIAGYAEPLADVPETPNSDCAARLNINKAGHGYFMEMTIGHEMGHMVQMADDCVETIHEALPTYIMILIVKYSGGFPIENFLEFFGGRYFTLFQTDSYRALDFANVMDLELIYYAYGHALFDMYIDERWGNSDGAIIADISFASRQDGTVAVSGGTASLAEGVNEPDLYEAIDAVLVPLDAGFWDAVKEFSIWRFFTGSRADTAHLQYGASLPGITYDTQFQMTDLPLTGLSPTNPPAETGSVYINLSVDPALVTSDQDMLSFGLVSNESQNWYIAAVVFNDDGTSRVVDATASDGEGHVGVTGLTTVTGVTFAVTNLGDLVHDPDHPDFSGNNFNYSMAFYTQPSITGVSPQRATQGDEGTVVTITGTGFAGGIVADFGEGVTVTGTIVAASGNGIDATLDVAGSAPLGWHALRVYYEDGPEARLEQGLEVVSGQGPEVTALTPDSAAPGETLNVEVTGQRFKNGTTLSLSGGGISVLRVDFIDQGMLIAEVDVDATADPGARDVTATNPDSKTGTLVSGFTVEGETTGDEAEPTDGGEGCGCSIPGRGDGPGGLSAALLILIALFTLIAAGTRGATKEM